MIEGLLDHLWQSTLFALIAAVVVLAFRRDGAHIRFGIWFAASVKFLIPLSFLILVGHTLHWKVAPSAEALPVLSAMATIVEPAATMTNPYSIGGVPLMRASGHEIGLTATFILVIWMAGVATVACHRAIQWWKFRHKIRTATALAIATPIPALETPTVLEPVVFGVFSPVLLLPVGISRELAHDELDAILAHEVCHWQRRDNLTALAHMLVEALFWFHPIIWWIGSRMVVERERACDETVVRSGRSRLAYAEGILRVCRQQVQRPFACTAAVSGGLLRRRIESILTSSVPISLHIGKRCFLGVAGTLAVIGPLAIGLSTGSFGVVRAQEPGDPEMRRYESSRWKFGLDIPKRWRAFPAVSSDSPFEVIRFDSLLKGGLHFVFVFRAPYNPKESLARWSTNIQQTLAKAGYSDFVSGETTIGGRRVVTLDFDEHMPDGTLWSCRQYYVLNGTYLYTLGFGTNRRVEMFALFDRIAKSFVPYEASG